ncbi:hypothetical protein LOK49_LG14G01655 [Camellia lanceoleosa]|uniref:Uncharacterized protein n=1 Tax=Camellia lanceoleosa TaxID=1840588 RepID=A0ACC0FC67_9ERIC|nr:hypothetical protein LOK49_LG14G01655 [Camellia lanceoleosa]
MLLLEIYVDDEAKLTLHGLVQKNKERVDEQKKKERVDEGQSSEDASDTKEEGKEERVIVLRPLNMEDMRQPRSMCNNLVEKCQSFSKEICIWY